MPFWSNPRTPPPHNIKILWKMLVPINKTMFLLNLEVLIWLSPIEIHAFSQFCLTLYTMCLCIIFTHKFLSQDRFKQIHWELAWYCMIPRGILTNWKPFPQVFFQNGGHKNTFSLNYRRISHITKRFSRSLSLLKL